MNVFQENGTFNSATTDNFVLMNLLFNLSTIRAPFAYMLIWTSNFCYHCGAFLIYQKRALSAFSENWEAICPVSPHGFNQCNLHWIFVKNQVQWKEEKLNSDRKCVYLTMLLTANRLTIYKTISFCFTSFANI